MNNELCPYCGEEPESTGIIVTCRTKDCPNLGHQMYKCKWNRRFVCFDKNEDPVFAGDRVKYQPKEWKQLSLIGHIVKQELPYHGYHIVREDAKGCTVNAFLPEDIELIKEGA